MGPGLLKKLCQFVSVEGDFLPILDPHILAWAGHIIRMEEQRIPKKVLNGNFHTARLVGRPRNRWADVVQRDTRQLLGIKRMEE